MYGQLHDAAALRRRACQNLQVFQVKPRKPKRAPRQRVRFARCACVTVTIIISAPESLGQGNGGYHTEKRAMKLIGRVAGESVGWSGRQLIVNDICRGLRVPHTSALTHTKTRENTHNLQNRAWARTKSERKRRPARVHFELEVDTMDAVPVPATRPCLLHFSVAGSRRRGHRGHVHHQRRLHLRVRVLLTQPMQLAPRHVQQMRTQPTRRRVQARRRL